MRAKKISRKVFLLLLLWTYAYAYPAICIEMKTIIDFFFSTNLFANLFSSSSSFSSSLHLLPFEENCSARIANWMGMSAKDETYKTFSWIHFVIIIDKFVYQTMLNSIIMIILLLLLFTKLAKMASPNQRRSHQLSVHQKVHLHIHFSLSYSSILCLSFKKL